VPLLSSYRRVLATPGARLFSATGLVARLPISMAGLGIVFLVQAGTGSYGVAGSVSGAYMIANALLAIGQGRLIDTLGQRVVLAAASVAFGISAGLLITSVQADWPIAISYVAAATAGGTLPSVGSSVRARWTHVLTAPDDLQTAYALEAVVDESVFMLGPIIVTVLATAVDPVMGLGAAAVLGTLGSLAFAAQRRTEPPAHPHDHTAGARTPMPWRTVLPLAVVCAALGILFGAAEVTTVAFADEQGHKAYAGGLLALWALGSLFAGVVTGAVSWRRGPSFRVRVGSIGMACAMAPLYFVGSVPLMGLLLLIGGVAIAPTLIATMSLTQSSVPPARLTEGMAIMQTGLVAGVAPGAALSGWIVDVHGASAAYLVSLAAGVLGAVAAQAVPRRRTADQPAAAEPTPETTDAAT
jgi:MFS family permease